MTVPELDDAVIREWSRRSRERQGLPAKITDPAVLHRVLVLAFGTPPPSGSTDPNMKPPGPPRPGASVPLTATKEVIGA